MYWKAVAVQGQGDTPLPDQALQQGQIPPGVLAGVKDSLDHDAGGIVHRQQQDELVPPFLQPGMVTAIHLNEHSLLGHALPFEPVLGGAPAAGAAHSCLHQDATYRGPAQVDPLPLPQQFGKVAVVGAGVILAGQLDHGSGLSFGHGVVGPTSPVTVGDRRGAVPAVGRQQALGVPFADSHDLGSLGDGQVVFQYAVEHFDPGLFLLIQCQFPHGVTFSLNS